MSLAYETGGPGFGSCHAHEPESLRQMGNGPWWCQICRREGYVIDGDPDAVLKPSADLLAWYRENLAKHGRAPMALGWTHDKQWIRYAALCASIGPDSTVLDYGCGFGDLADWLKLYCPFVDYIGCDIMPEVIEQNAKLRPDLNWMYLPDVTHLRGEFDHIVCCGVFNRVTGPLHEFHARGTIERLFAHTRKALHVDFLTNFVDFTKDSDWHPHKGEVFCYVSSLGRRHVIDCSYLPYEYCVHLFKDAEIERPRNVYGRGI